MNWRSCVVLSDLFEIGELDRVEGCWALGHGYTVTGNCVGHIVIVDQVHKRLVFIYLLVWGILFSSDFSIYACFDVIVFQEVWGNFINSGSKLLNAIVWKSDSALLWQSSENLPLFSGLTCWWGDFITHLDSTLCIDCISKINYHRFLIFTCSEQLAKWRQHIERLGHREIPIIRTKVTI